MLLGGGTCRLANPAQRQPESNLLLEPAKQNRHIFSSLFSRTQEFPAEISESKPCFFMPHSQALPSPPEIFPGSAHSHSAQEIK